MASEHLVDPSQQDNVDAGDVMPQPAQHLLRWQWALFIGIVVLATGLVLLSWTLITAPDCEQATLNWAPCLDGSG
ncbi:hypothetical protein [Auritidibacter sp. NML100628]|uniref:hypothetical protein n=1 Tax=Auritidibacter sp. NML100628 TaxID=2170742 RepID=UPI000D73839B|nr:hypothetical protein [Auritidibacter sp. NML100628]PXA78154.1 hypothetical protein DCC24_00155 [Auritidibacter sp. NML100628]